MERYLLLLTFLFTACGTLNELSAIESTGYNEAAARGIESEQLLKNFAESAKNDVCSTAPEGTYTSNVCWIVKNYSTNREFDSFNGSVYVPANYVNKVEAVDEENCTITFETMKANLTGSIVSRDNITIHFENIDFNQTYYSTAGSGFRIVSIVNFEGSNMIERNGQLESSLRMYSKDRIERRRLANALDNLYLRYCDSSTSEF